MRLKLPLVVRYKKIMNTIYVDLRKRIQIVVSKNQYRHPHSNDLNFHNYHPHIFPYQPLHPDYFGNTKYHK